MRTSWKNVGKVGALRLDCQQHRAPCMLLRDPPCSPRPSSSTVRNRYAEYVPTSLAYLLSPRRHPIFISALGIPVSSVQKPPPAGDATVVLHPGTGEWSVHSTPISNCFELCAVYCSSRFTSIPPSFVFFRLLLQPPRRVIIVDTPLILNTLQGLDSNQGRWWESYTVLIIGTCSA